MSAAAVASAWHDNNRGTTPYAYKKDSNTITIYPLIDVDKVHHIHHVRVCAGVSDKQVIIAPRFDLHTNKFPHGDDSAGNVIQIELHLYNNTLYDNNTTTFPVCPVKLLIEQNSTAPTSPQPTVLISVPGVSTPEPWTIHKVVPLTDCDTMENNGEIGVFVIRFHNYRVDGSTNGDLVYSLSYLFNI